MSSVVLAKPYTAIRYCRRLVGRRRRATGKFSPEARANPGSIASTSAADVADVASTAASDGAATAAGVLGVASTAASDVAATADGASGRGPPLTRLAGVPSSATGSIWTQDSFEMQK